MRDLVADKALADRLLADLAALRHVMRELRVPSASPLTQTPLQAEVAVAADLLGVALVDFALARSPGDTQDAEAWSEDLDTDESEAGLEEDTAESVDAARQDPPDDPNGADEEQWGLSKEQKRRLRAWARKLVATGDVIGTVDRLLPVRMVFHLIALDVWDHDAWFPLLADLLVGFEDVGQPPPEAEARVASIAAVGLAMLRLSVPSYDKDSPNALRCAAVTRAVEHLLPAMEDRLVAEYSSGLVTAFGVVLEPGAVQAVAEQVVQADPMHDALYALEEQGHPAHTDHPAVIHMLGEVPSPTFTALAAIAAAQTTRVAAWARSTTKGWVLLVWQEPDLYCIQPQRGLVTWTQYRCNQRITPRAILAARDFALANRVRRGATKNPIPEAVAIMVDMGVDITRGPHCPRAADVN